MKKLLAIFNNLPNGSEDCDNLLSWFKLSPLPPWPLFDDRDSWLPATFSKARAA